MKNWKHRLFYGKMSRMEGDMDTQSFTRSVIDWYDSGHLSLIHI